MQASASSPDLSSIHTHFTDELWGGPIPTEEFWGETIPIDDEIVPLASALNNPSQIEDKKRGLLSRCDRKMAARVMGLALTSGVFALTTYFLVRESLGSHNVKGLSLEALANGASCASFGHMLLPAKARKKANEWINAWSYEAILAGSQVYLNLAPQEQMKLFAVPFVWTLGALQMKDILALLSMDQSELFVSHVPPNQGEILPTLGFNTRNYSRASKMWMTALATTALSLTVLNFTLLEGYLGKGDLGKIGFYQDLIALFSGSVVGEMIARLFDDKKEAIESRHLQQLISQEPSIVLKAMRVIKNIGILSAPVLIGACLSVEIPPNTWTDYLNKMCVGGIYGADLFLARREFENLSSRFHAVAYPENGGQLPTLCQRIKGVAKTYLPSIGFFSAMVGFMGWAAATNIPRVDYAIVVLLITTLSSFVFTDLIAKKGRPQGHNRLHNELNFRLIHSALALSVFFQYLTTKVDIGDEQLDGDSDALYALSLISWFFWGLNVGNNRAINIQEPRIPVLPVSPPVAMQELSKTFVRQF
ncbi:hypothetical protein [Candidatus Protochlamydia phocaeensis]|uniref:hypothetical protein n=1 Tax=Candidatus Protochlamydia phocaeensis TaxID=1414722 RepID=UPI000837E0DF|nr:hypothetical protein [Candidatus Protochlamydia phocaeensis]